MALGARHRRAGLLFPAGAWRGLQLAARRRFHAARSRQPVEHHVGNQAGARQCADRAHLSDARGVGGGQHELDDIGCAAEATGARGRPARRARGDPPAKRAGARCLRGDDAAQRRL